MCIVFKQKGKNDTVVISDECKQNAFTMLICFAFYSFTVNLLFWFFWIQSLLYCIWMQIHDALSLSLVSRWRKNTALLYKSDFVFSLIIFCIHTIKESSSSIQYWYSSWTSFTANIESFLLTISKYNFFCIFLNIFFYSILDFREEWFGFWFHLINMHYVVIHTCYACRKTASWLKAKMEKKKRIHITKVPQIQNTKANTHIHFAEK